MSSVRRVSAFLAVSLIGLVGIRRRGFRAGLGRAGASPIQIFEPGPGRRSLSQPARHGGRRCGFASAWPPAAAAPGQSSSQLNNAVQVNSNNTYNVTVSGSSNYLNFGGATVNAQQTSTGTKQASSNSTSATKNGSSPLPQPVGRRIWFACRPHMCRARRRSCRLYGPDAHQPGRRARRRSCAAPQHHADGDSARLHALATKLARPAHRRLRFRRRHRRDGRRHAEFARGHPASRHDDGRRVGLRRRASRQPFVGQRLRVGDEQSDGEEAGRRAPGGRRSSNRSCSVRFAPALFSAPRDYVTGAVTELNWNIDSGVAEAGAYSAVIGKRTYRISVAIDVVVTNTQTTEIVYAKSYKKQLVGFETNANFFRFVNQNTALQILSLGNAAATTVTQALELFDANLDEKQNEPTQTALRWVIELAAYDIMRNLKHTGNSCDSLLPPADVRRRRDPARARRPRPARARRRRRAASRTPRPHRRRRSLKSRLRRIRRPPASTFRRPQNPSSRPERTEARPRGKPRLPPMAAPPRQPMPAPRPMAAPPPAAREKPRADRASKNSRQRVAVAAAEKTPRLLRSRRQRASASAREVGFPRDGCRRHVRRGACRAEAGAEAAAIGFNGKVQWECAAAGAEQRRRRAHPLDERRRAGARA